MLGYSICDEFSSLPRTVDFNGVTSQSGVISLIKSPEVKLVTLKISTIKSPPRFKSQETKAIKRNQNERIFH